MRNLSWCPSTKAPSIIAGRGIEVTFKAVSFHDAYVGVPNVRRAPLCSEHSMLRLCSYSLSSATRR